MSLDESLRLDQEFFNALLTADGKKLGDLLVEDFVLIDVMRGGEVSKAQLLGVVTSGELIFEEIEVRERRGRSYGAASLITGLTSMKMRFGGQQISVISRYTHVFIQRAGRSLMAAAQGTRIEPI